MREILDDVRRWRASGERFALATVVATRRSAPRPVGSKLGVSAAGELLGSVSGGCVENEVYGCAREVLAGGPPRLLGYGISDDDAFGVGLPCGGEIDVFVEEPDPQLVDRMLQAYDSGERLVRLTVVAGEDLGASALVPEGGDLVGHDPAGAATQADELIRDGHNRLLELEGRRVFADLVAPPPRLLVFGAVDTAEELCKAANALGWHTTVADARGKFATRDRLPSPHRILVKWPDEALAQVQPDHATAVVVLTHDDRFDLPAIAGALDSDAFYIGALGSRRNQERRRERLLEAGVDEEALTRVSGPCGLDLGANTPAETAVSILAEILARRNGRAGGMLMGAPGRIHVDVA